MMQDCNMIKKFDIMNFEEPFGFAFVFIHIFLNLRFAFNFEYILKLRLLYLLLRCHIKGDLTRERDEINCKCCMIK